MKTKNTISNHINAILAAQSVGRRIALGLAVLAVGFTPGIARAQNNNTSPDNGASSGPVRMARFSFVQGDVTWRSGDNADWSPASLNFPLRQGAQIWTSDNSRAEIQFDDGSRMRLDKNTLLTVQTLYSDTQGEFTEISLNDGEVYLRLNNKYSLYQVNTAVSSLKASGPARVRVGSGDGAQYMVKRGSAVVEGANDKATVNEGDYLDVVDANTPYTVQNAPRGDTWDAYNDSRDREIDDAGNRSRSHLPANIALVGDDLDLYGSWHTDSAYGTVWVPAHVVSGWRPYSDGHWTWVEPYGWTWVGNERWGWAPYHYGTWVSRPYGWGWVPGPATQYWSPAVVSFSYNSGNVAWCPLAPREVHYPAALSIGFHSGNWSAFFSIGGAAVYYPTARHYCEPRPWGNNYVNRVTYNRTVINNINRTNITNVRNVTVNNITVNRNTYLTRNNFVPQNAAFAGGSQVSSKGFGGRETYAPVSRTQGDVFRRGQVVAAPAAGGRPVMGPQSVAVNRAAFTPTRSYRASTPMQQQVARQSVYRAALPASVPRTPAVHGQQFNSRENPRNVSRPTGMPTSGRPTTPNGTTPRGSNTRPGNDTRALGTRPDPTRPGTPTRTTPTNPGSGTRSNPGLDAYLKERNARNGGTTTPGRTGGRGDNPNPPTRDPRTAPGGRTNPPTVRDNPIPSRNPRTPGGNPIPGRTDTPARTPRVPGGTPGEGSSYRPLHTNRSAPSTPLAPRDSRTAPRTSPPPAPRGESGGRGDNRGGDRGNGGDRKGKP